MINPVKQGRNDPCHCSSERGRAPSLRRRPREACCRFDVTPHWIPSRDLGPWLVKTIPRICPGEVDEPLRGLRDASS